MGWFDKILSTLGIGGAKAATPSTPPPQPKVPAPDAPAVSAPAPAPRAIAPETMPMVDVVADLERRAAAAPQKLNWRTSIVDLLKLLGIDSSYGARKEMAVELGCPPELMDDSAQMNMWLHKTVLQKIAANGGNIPADLLD